MLLCVKSGGRVYSQTRGRRARERMKETFNLFGSEQTSVHGPQRRPLAETRQLSPLTPFQHPNFANDKFPSQQNKTSPHQTSPAHVLAAMFRIVPLFNSAPPLHSPSTPDVPSHWLRSHSCSLPHSPLPNPATTKTS